MNEKAWIVKCQEDVKTFLNRASRVFLEEPGQVDIS